MATLRRIVGIHAAQAALDHSPEKIVSAWIDLSRQDARLLKLRDALEAAGIAIKQVDRKQLERFAERRPHQGILVEIDLPTELGESDLRDYLDQGSGQRLFLVLDHVQDPHNLGACLRTADAAAVDGIITTRDQSVGITATVSKVSSGAAETVPLYRVTNLARTLGWLKESGIWVAGAAGEADKTVYETDMTLPLAIVIGAEGTGLRRLTRERCDFLFKIPMYGQVESLNLSVATGVILFEAVRQRHIAKK